MNDTAASSKATLASVDYFALVGLGHLSMEEKQDLIGEWTVTALQMFTQEDLPALLSSEDFAEFEKLISEDNTKGQAMDFLIEKVPNFQDKLQERVLFVKKQMLEDNLSEQLEQNKVRGELLRAQADSDETRKERIANETLTTKLHQALKAMEIDDWDSVSKLLTPKV